jgi:SAM-dependent methyltransferase
MTRPREGEHVVEGLFRLYLQQAARRGVLVVNTARVDGDAFTCYGHGLAPFGLELPFRLAVCGRPATFRWCRPSEPLTKLFGFGTVYEFEAEVPLSAVTDGLAVIQPLPGGGGEPLEDQTFCFPLEEPVMPEPERRLRVHGTVEKSSYLVQGASCAWKIRRVLQTHFGREISSFSSVLDWGCGCGRVLQQLGVGPQTGVRGCDVDGDNVSWCREHLPFAAFDATRPDPPLPCEDASFDLVYGISVFTHLGQQDESRWLQELRRVARPGAAVLMSVHGAQAMFHSKPDPAQMDSLCRDGILDVGANAALVGVVEEAQRYRDVFHLPEYVGRVWSRHFELLDILPGFISSIQDLVVMRRSSSTDT